MNIFQPQGSRVLDREQIHSIANKLTRNLRPEIDELSRPLTPEQIGKIDSMEIHSNANNLAYTLVRKFQSALLERARDYAFNRKSDLVGLQDVKRAYKELTTD